MARIADKHGLTNKYRPIGSGKRVVRRGRPRKYLFGPPSRKRKTYKSSTYRSSGYKGTNNYANMDINTSGCTSAALIPFFVILLIMFSLIPIFRCLIPIIVGAGLLFVVEEYCKKSWGLPTGRWSKPVSIGWTILTAFAMVVGFVLVLLVQVAEIPAIVIFIFAFVYAGLSVLILRKKYNKVKTQTTKDGNRSVVSFPQNPSFNTKKLSATDHAELATSNLRTMAATFDFAEFLKAYKNVLYHQEQVTKFWRSQGGDADSEELLESLVAEKEDYINEFFDRCYSEGILQQLKEKILSHSSELTSSNIQYMEELLNDELDAMDSADEEAVVREACSKLKKNLRIDMAFWNEMHLDFRCNLVTSYDQLQLNYEIKNTSGVPWYCGSGGIEIKANVYNADGDLLCVEDDYIDDDEIAKNRYSAYILFHLDDVQEAAYIEVFAHQDM